MVLIFWPNLRLAVLIKLVLIKKSVYIFHSPFKLHVESSLSGLISLIFCFAIDYKRLDRGYLEDLNHEKCAMKFKGPSTVLRGLKFLPEK